MAGNRTTLGIAGITICLEGPPHLLKALDSGRYRDFLCTGQSPDLLITLNDSPGEFSETMISAADRVFDSGTVWSLYESENKVSILLRSPVHDGAPYRFATFDRDLSRGEITTLAGASGAAGSTDYDPMEFPLSEILAVCLLSRGRMGLMVHACGISIDGRGLLFAGNSTDGKSTIAGLWKGSALILNDDRIILRRTDDGIRMYGTPWHGDISDVSAHGAELESVYFLSHGTENRIEKVSGADAVSKLLKRSFLPLWSREGMDFSLDFCSGLVSSVPCRTLAFVPDSGVIELLKCRS